jgi:hypothetical protein
MAFKNIQGNVRNSLLDYFVSGKAVQYHSNQFGGAVILSGLTATGGVISDYTDGSTVYRAHIFTSSGTFNVTATGSYGDTVEYLVVAGGGGGAARHGGGGGAGGLLVSPGFTGIPTSQNQGSSITIPGTLPAPYSITVGAGGVGGMGPDSNNSPTTIGTQGGPSSFGPVSTTGGGYGASYIPSPPGANPGGPGGSGGGGSNFDTSTFGIGGPATNYPGPTQQGFPGGAGGPGVPSHGAGAGGGAGEAGQNAVSPQTGGRGGAGLTVYIASPPAQPAPQNSFAGGGGGGGDIAGAGSPIGGGGAGGAGGGQSGTAGTFATGGGGGGSRTIGPGNGGNGGSGIVVVRYQIAQLTATAKATGGSISYYNGKTIHTFTSSGTFAAPSPLNPTSLSVEYVVVGGGGAGGSGQRAGGGGGAGQYLTGSSTIPSGSSFPISIGAGGAQVTTSTEGTSASDGALGTQTVATFPAGTITSGGGGGGGGYQRAGKAGSPTGASGGGGGRDGSSAGPSAGPGGNPGGTGGPGSGYGGAGGGGGAGGAGVNGSNPGASTETAGPGGPGVQVPATFRNPQSATSLGTPGPGGAYYIAGGGGGTAYRPGGQGTGGVGGGGAGSSEVSGGTPGQQYAKENTGSGGGGGGTGTYLPAGSGGSGIVLIAYPS